MTVDALAPAWNPLDGPFTETTTGKVATPELDDAIDPTDVTLPVAAEPVAVAALALDCDPVGLAAAPNGPPKPPKPPKPPRAELLEVDDELVGVTVADCPTFKLPSVVVSTLRFTT